MSLNTTKLWNGIARKSKLYGSILMVFYRNVQKKLQNRICMFQFYVGLFFTRADNSDRNVCVRPSVTRRYCVSPSGSPKTLVFWRQISSSNSKGFSPRTGASKKVGVRKFSDFLALSVNISLYLFFLIETRKMTPTKNSAVVAPLGEWVWMKIDPYCQQRNCSPLNALFSDV